jgi:hypothetical protein
MSTDDANVVLAGFLDKCVLCCLGWNVIYETVSLASQVSAPTQGTVVLQGFQDTLVRAAARFVVAQVCLCLVCDLYELI